MNVLFMSLGVFYDLTSSSVHIDILKRIAEEHSVYLVCKNEGEETKYNYENGINVLRVHTGELKRVGIIKKGINTILVEYQFERAIKKILNDIRFDLVIYTTPPITFVRPITYVKKRDKAVTYLMLKDIFPQNAVDIGMMSTDGVKGLLYKYFRKKEKKLYEISDYIGCMSEANINYIKQNNEEIDAYKLEMCPNITVIEDLSINEETRNEIRRKYKVPLDATVFIYGGNLGKPQGIPFLIECLEKCRLTKGAFFLIIGQGTEYGMIENYIASRSPENCMLMRSLPKADYETLVSACDVGLIFLDHRFTIPNFPSRILSYMKARVPVFAVTDPNTDIGDVIKAGNFGWWCESDNSDRFKTMIEKIVAEKDALHVSGDNGFEYMKNHYNPDIAYHTIIEKCQTDN